MRKLPLSGHSVSETFSSPDGENMRKSRLTETPIVAVLQEEAGVPIAELLRKHAVSRPTYSNWKAKYGGTAVPERRRRKELEQENAKLKRMCADLALENAAILVQEHRRSIVTACQIAGLSRTATIRPASTHARGAAHGRVDQSPQAPPRRGRCTVISTHPVSQTR